MPNTPSHRLIFRHQGGTVEIAPTSLLVFIDDTGDESLKDPNVPFFGFGGCVIPASHYIRNLDTPWKEVEKHFSAEMLPLHAADLKPQELGSRLGYINTFFENGFFGRFGTVISNETIIDTEQSIYHILARDTYRRAAEVGSGLYVEIDRVDMIFEHSERTEKIMTDYFSRYEFKNNEQPLPVQRWTMNKSKELLSGLVVADFIAHTAGVSVRSRLREQSEAYERRDFKAVFKPPNEKITSFFEMIKIEPNE